MQNLCRWEVLMASVAKRADGRWRARYRDETGREHAKHFQRKVDAQQWLSEQTAALVTGTHIDPRSGRTPYGEWAHKWRATLALKPKSLVSVDSLLRTQVLPRWAAVLDRITHEDVGAWVVELSARLSASRARQAYHVLTGSLDAAVRSRRLAVNPAVGVSLPRLRPRSRRYLSHGEVLRLLDAASGQALPIAVLAYVGIRWGELAGMRVRSLDMLRGRLEVVETVDEINGVLTPGTPKDHERRSVALPKSLRAELAAHLNGKQPNDYVFTSRTGSPLRSGNFRRDVFDPAARATGLDGLTPHELRHTAASVLVDQGANVLAGARQLGHADPSVTLRIYADLFDDHLDEVADRLDQAIADARHGLLRTNRGLSDLAELDGRTY
jgi:integrase